MKYLDLARLGANQIEEDFQTVVSGELALLDPGVRGNAEAVQALLHDDFREFGASGTVWDRVSIVSATTRDATEPIVAEDLRSVRLGPNTIMLTYTARRGQGASLRTSVWVRVDGEWRILHHQGTRLPTER